MSKPSYKTIREMLELLPSSNRKACLLVYQDHYERFKTSPGSKHNHQNWLGGYHDHITEALNIAALLYQNLNSIRELPFELSDAIIVIFLHDLETPFKYRFENGIIIKDKAFKTPHDDEQKRKQMIEEYGIRLTDNQRNAMNYIEGIRDAKYSPTDRVMGELAAFCHCADTISARIWYDHPSPSGKDLWSGAVRISGE